MKVVIIIIIIILLLILFHILWFRNYRKVYISDKTPQVFKADLDLQDENYFTDKKVIICGLARDIKENIPYIRKTLQKLTGLFQDHLIVIVENDSTDQSRDLLLSLKNEFKVVLLGCGIDSKKCVMKSKKHDHDRSRNRIQKMVDLRNIYMDYINKISPEEYDFVIIIDFDLMTSLYIDGLLNSAYYFNKFPEIDMIGANGVNINHSIILQIILGKFEYYDSYAMIPIYKYIDSTIKTSGDLNKDLIRMKSAFGGMVIYRFKNIHGNRYKYEEDKYEVAVCEHVVFNRSLNNIFINPRFILPVLKNP